MKLRAQLVLAAFLLAVLPLTAIVVYSHHSSRRALEAAYRHEAARMTRQMNARLAEIRGEVETRLASVSELPLQQLPRKSERNLDPIVDEVFAAMADATPIVDSVEFHPTIVHIEPGMAGEHPPQPPAHAESTAPETPAAAGSSASAAGSAAFSNMTPFPPEPPVATEPVVIDLAAMPRLVRSKEDRDMLREIGELSTKLADQTTTMPAEEREAIRRQIDEKNAALQTSLAAKRRAFDQQMHEVTRARAERIRAMVAQRQQVVRERQTPPAPALPRTSDATRDATYAPAPAAATAVPVTSPSPSPAPRVQPMRTLTAEERKELAARARQAALLFGRELNATVERQGKIVGRVTAQISPDEVVRRVLGPASDDGNDIAFAIDREGHLYTRSDAERRILERTGIAEKARSGQPVRMENWIVATTRTGQGGPLIGVARRVGDNLEELRLTAARNFSYGLGLAALALVGIIPLSSRMTRDVKRVTEGAERIAQGDLETRVPVRSRNEFGQLAAAFNRMAAELAEHQQRLLDQRVMQVEYERKAADLEEARRFQLSLLPKEIPQLDRFQLAVFTRPATEVGGDYYDFHTAGEGITVAIGDATGHGAKAGTMVTVIKTLFSSYAGEPPAEFLATAAEKIKRMELGRMSMALALARLEPGRLTMSSAGMPPALLYRAASRRVEEIALSATPLGTIGSAYEEREVALAKGDTVLLMTDGFPELTNAAGQQLGYPAALEAFAAVADREVEGVIDGLVDAARAWHGDQPPNDDMTFVAVRVC
jgi:serine phosphatase RsbU (regulator of sigma subunit)